MLFDGSGDKERDGEEDSDSGSDGATDGGAGGNAVYMVLIPYTLSAYVVGGMVVCTCV